MSALLALVRSQPQPAHDAVVRGMLGRMHERGADEAAVWRDGSTTLAVARHDWEFGPGFSGPVLAVTVEACTVVADASLYYRDDLRRRLAAAGVRAPGQTPSHLILAAYQAWGERCVERLEGDFAFLLWDRRQRRLLAACDFVGGRPLFHADLPDGSFVVASTIGAILAHPACQGEIDLTEVGIDAAGLSFSLTDATCYRGIRRLSAATRLVRGPSGRVQRSTFWEPVREPAASRTGFDDAADELRDLLAAAVSERTDLGGPSSVWLSGGWDSTAVFAAGQHALGAAGGTDGLRPVSIGLPASDQWCESHHIRAAAGRWDAPIAWIESDGVPLLPAPTDDATARAEPWAHPYEQLKRALVRRSRDVGTRVALNGHGGDMLFHMTPVLLADLLRTGRLGALRREWAVLGEGAGSREFFRWAVAPLLPSPALRLGAWLRGGRRFAGYLERSIPGWFDAGFAARAALPARAAAGSPRAGRGSRAAFEMHWLLTRPHYARVVASVCGFGLEDGVEVRLPLLDRRLIDFALRRPWQERSSGGQRKRLLRRAMRDLLPAEVLAPRPFKTGRLTGYFARGMRETTPLLARLASDSALVESGVVDARRLAGAVQRFGQGGHFGLGMALMYTLVVDLWLQARTAPVAPVPDRPLPATVA